MNKTELMKTIEQANSTDELQMLVMEALDARNAPAKYKSMSYDEASLELHAAGDRDLSAFFDKANAKWEDLIQLENCATTEKLHEFVLAHLASISQDLVERFKFTNYYNAADELRYSGNNELANFFERAGTQWDSIIDKELGA